MDSFSPQEQEINRAQRESSIFDLPQYVISYNDDHTLRWDPPAGSKELSIALSYHFPLEQDLGSKMQAATRKFLRNERQKKSSDDSKTVGTFEHLNFDALPLHMDTEDQVTRQNMKVPESPSHVKSGSIASHRISMPETRTIQFLTWDADMKEFSPKIKKRRYDKEERVKVAANRGFACARHRRQKMKCDPERCSRNKQRLSSLENMAAKVDAQSTLHKRHSSFIPDPETASQINTTIDPETFTLNSTPSSDPPPRWTTSSFVDPATLYKLEGFHTSAQSLDFPTPSLEFSSRSHDSIGSVLSTSSDMNFLAGYDGMNFDISSYETYPWWPRNDHFDPAGSTFNDFMPIDQTVTVSNTSQMETFELQDKQASTFEQPLIEPPQQLIWSHDVIVPEPNYIIESDSTPLRPSSSPMENTTTLVDESRHCQQDLMEWDAARPSSVTQGYFCNNQVKPLTDEEKRTLIKWWGRDRSSEQQESIRGRQNSYGSQPSNGDMAGVETQSGTGVGKKASLREKVKTATVHVPPFPRSLFRSRSAGKEKKP
ncbi:hypothetical protein sscle_04g039290 [Sclerotinia sclerotiorum 1980 UF-70]|uniref:Uncharacterized protein n=2 Tax=Sclerotinia sclerotiorum (strain ATCC 18683 / 1980 / Ss-1) TaxID=665079 RepID=A0A1D9Q2R7_SCLS1|nr:hypothetical protein sscle_04g039290 [Sclerotinia sclerotiorum 1980 UF-70]